MRDVEIMQRDDAVGAQCAQRLVKLAHNFDRNLNALGVQLQRASQVSIQNHLKHEALLALVLDPPVRWDVPGLRWLRRRPTAADYEARFRLLEADMAAKTAERAAAEARAQADTAAAQAAAKAAVAAADAAGGRNSNVLLAPDGKPVSTNGARKGVVTAGAESAPPAAGADGGDDGGAG